MHGERSAFAARALDGEPAAVAIEDVLDQREAEAGAALRAAVDDIDTIESFGQTRQMFGRDARPVVADRDARFRCAVHALCTLERDLDLLSVGAVFKRVLHQIFERANELVAVAE